MSRERDSLRWPRVRLFDGEIVRLDAMFELPPIIYRANKRRTLLWLPFRDDVRSGRSDERLTASLQEQLVRSSHLVSDPRLLPRYGAPALMPLPTDTREFVREHDADLLDLRIFAPVPLG